MDPIATLWGRCARWEALEDEAARLPENESSGELAGLLLEAMYLINEPDPSPVYVWDDSKRKLVEKKEISPIENLPCDLVFDGSMSCVSEDPLEKLRRLITYGHERTDKQLGAELAYKVKQERKFLDAAYAVLRDGEVISDMDGRLIAGYKSLDVHFWKLKSHFDAIQKAIAGGDADGAMLLYVSGPDPISVQAVNADLNSALDDIRARGLVKLAGESLALGAVAATGGVAAFEGALILSVPKNFAATLFAPAGFVFGGRAWSGNLWDNSLPSGENIRGWLEDYAAAVATFSIVGRAAAAIGSSGSAPSSEFLKTYLRQSTVFAAYTPHEVLFSQVIRNGAIDADSFVRETASPEAFVSQQATLFSIAATGYPLERAGSLFGEAAEGAESFRSGAREFLKERYLPDGTPVGEFGGILVSGRNTPAGGWGFIPYRLDQVISGERVPITRNSNFVVVVRGQIEERFEMEVFFGDRSLGTAEFSVEGDSARLVTPCRKFKKVDLSTGTMRSSEITKLLSNWLGVLTSSLPLGEEIPKPAAASTAFSPPEPKRTGSGLITPLTAVRMHPLNVNHSFAPVPVRLPLGLARRLLRIHGTEKILNDVLLESLVARDAEFLPDIRTEFGNVLGRMFDRIFSRGKMEARDERAFRELIALIWEARGEGFIVDLDSEAFARTVSAIDAWEVYKLRMVENMAELSGSRLGTVVMEVSDASFVEAMTKIAEMDVARAREKASGFKNHAGPRWERLYGEYRAREEGCTALSPAEYKRLWIARRAIAAMKTHGLRLPAGFDVTFADLKRALDAEPLNWAAP